MTLHTSRLHAMLPLNLRHNVRQVHPLLRMRRTTLPLLQYTSSSTNFNFLICSLLFTPKNVPPPRSSSPSMRRPIFFNRSDRMYILSRSFQFHFVRTLYWQTDPVILYGTRHYDHHLEHELSILTNIPQHDYQIAFKEHHSSNHTLHYRWNDVNWRLLSGGERSRNVSLLVYSYPHTF